MLPFPRTLTLMETTWGTQDMGKITGKGKAMQTISHWADGMKAWQLLHSSLLPGSPSGPSFPEHKLHLVSLLWGEKSARTQKARKRGRAGNLALLLSILPLLGGVCYLHIPSGILLLLLLHSQADIHFLMTWKKPKTKNNNKKDQQKIISSDFPKQLNFKQRPSLKHFSQKADV